MENYILKNLKGAEAQIAQILKEFGLLLALNKKVTFFLLIKLYLAFR
jgi:hypothetical protein